MSLPVAVLAGGLATRLGPLTQATPKSLVDVGGVPFAVRQIELLRSHGVTEFVFCIGHLAESIVTALGDGRRWGVSIDYAFDGPVALGTGGALRNALPALGDAFFVLYGDSYLRCDYRAIAAAFRDSGKRGLMTVLRNEGRWDTSNVSFADGLILRYDKKTLDASMQHIDYGLGVLRADVLAAYPQGSPLDLSTVYQDLLAAGDLAAYEVDTRFYEIGSPAGLDETRAYFAGLGEPA